MKTIICFLIFASTAFGFVNLNRPKIKSGDFKRLTNGQWKGKLNYQDYRSNKKVSIKKEVKYQGTNEFFERNEYSLDSIK